MAALRDPRHRRSGAQAGAEVTDIDGTLVKLTEDMITTMYAAPGARAGRPAGRRAGSASSSTTSRRQAPVLLNPEIIESRGEWAYEEGCLSVPGLAWEIVRPKEVHLTGYDLDGNEVSIEADELLARCSSTSSTTSTACSSSSASTDEQRGAAKRAVREMLTAPAGRRRRSSAAGPPPALATLSGERSRPLPRGPPRRLGVPRDPGAGGPAAAGAVDAGFEVLARRVHRPIAGAGGGGHAPVR